MKCQLHGVARRGSYPSLVDTHFELQLPLDMGGGEGKALFIDTEGGCLGLLLSVDELPVHVCFAWL